MKLIVDTLICTIALFLIFDVPHIILAVNEDISDIGLVIMWVLHIGFIVAFYILKKFDLYAISLSHLIFAFLFYFSLILIRFITKTGLSPEAWELPGFYMGVFVFLPISVITFIISFIIKKVGE